MANNTRAPVLGKPARYPKAWGEEVWIANNDRYCGKLLRFTACSAGSMHYHLNKQESWYVLSGALELDCYDLTDGRQYTLCLREGDAVEVPVGTPHRLRALSDAVIVEVSTPHSDDDSYRLTSSMGAPP